MQVSYGREGAHIGCWEGVSPAQGLLRGRGKMGFPVGGRGRSFSNERRGYAITANEWN